MFVRGLDKFGTDCRSSTAFNHGMSWELDLQTGCWIHELSCWIWKSRIKWAKPLDCVGRSNARVTHRKRLMASGHHRFFWVVVAVGGVVDCAVWLPSFSVESLGFVQILDIWYVDGMNRLHFIVRAAKPFSLPKLHATCLHYSNLIPLSLLISSDQSRFTMLRLIE